MGFSSFGTLLQIGDGGGPETFTTIGEVKDISGPSLALDTEDATSHDSTDGWEVLVPTILRSGEVTFDINFDPDEGTHDITTGLLADEVAKTLRHFKLIFPDLTSTEWAFSAYVTGFETSAPVAGVLGASVTLKPSGQPTLA
jgi:hypothetical protein